MNSGGKILRRSIVHGYGDCTPQDTSEKSRHPLGAVLAPQQNAIPFSDCARLQFPCNLRRGSSHLGIRHSFCPIPSALDEHTLAAMLRELVDKAGYRPPFHVFQCSAAGRFSPRRSRTPGSHDRGTSTPGQAARPWQRASCQTRTQGGRLLAMWRTHPGASSQVETPRPLS